MKADQSRRQFIKRSLAASAGMAIATSGMPLFAKDKANEKIRLGVIGIRSRGLYLAKDFAGLANCEITTLCDVDSRYLPAAVEQVAKIQGKKPQTVTDFRRILDDKDIDAIVIATPDHWHAPMAIEGLKAGKHVYVEKPCSHNPREGELLVEAQKRYNGLVQMGNQRRSQALSQQMIREIHNGSIGEVYFAKGWYCNNRKPIAFGKVTSVPEYLDFNLWQGPAPRTAYRDNVHPYNWHWFWNWGTGEALNNGTHEIDLIRWAFNQDYANKISSFGHRSHFNEVDDWECPDNQTIQFEFAKGKIATWEGLSCVNYASEKTGRGVLFHGTKGSIVYRNHEYEIFDQNRKSVKIISASDAQANVATNTTDPGLNDRHSLNFLEAIRGKETLNSPIDEGHKSVLLCQLGNISLRVGRTLQLNKWNGHIEGDREAMKLWTREYEPGWEPTI